MIRTIKYTVSNDFKNVSPSSKQWAGMQFEDNATKVTFVIPSAADNEILWRIDFDSPSSGYDPSENLTVTNGEVSRLVPYKMTRYGGEVQVTLVGTTVNSNNKAVKVVYSIPVVLYFTDVKQHDEGTVAENISAAEKSAIQAASTAEAAANNAKTAKDKAETAATKAVNASKEATDKVSLLVSSMLTRKIIDKLPNVTNTSETVIYMIKKSNAEQNVYDEYMLIDGVLKNIGSTAVNLSDYATKAELVGKKTTEGGEIFNNYSSNTASGNRSHSEGNATNASEFASHAEGNNTVASGYASHAEGNGTIASETNAHAEGKDTQAAGYASHAEGSSTTAGGGYSHAEGHKTKAESAYAHTEGYYNTASGVASHAEGNYNTASGYGSHVEGGFKEGDTHRYNHAAGDASHAEGASTEAVGEASHAEGYNTNARGSASHAEGRLTYALATRSHAEGGRTTAFGESAHAEGWETYAYGARSHAEGQGDIIEKSDGNGGDNPVFDVNGNIQHISGAFGKASHVEGNKTITGRYNRDTNDYTPDTGNYAHAEGNYTMASGKASHAEGSSSRALGENAHAEGDTNVAIGDSSHAEGSQTRTGRLNTEAELASLKNYSNYVRGTEKISDANCINGSGWCAHAEGHQTIALNQYSHAEGRLTRALHDGAHAEGNETVALGEYSHAEGGSTHAVGKYSHAEGNLTSAEGSNSHVEGDGTEATAQSAHAEGTNCKATAHCAHAEGDHTIAAAPGSHVEGRYNKEDTTVSKTNPLGKYVHITGIGIGTAESQRRNGFTVCKNGHGSFSGAVCSCGSDYAEFFEWFDGNPNAEDRIGLIVSLDGEKIKLASTGDEILGIISGTVAVLGDNYEWDWNGKYLTDAFGRIVYEDVEFFENKHMGVDADGNPIVEKQFKGYVKYPVINSEYNPEQEYISRNDRKEWETVGLLGKLYVRDDGTAQVNGYVTAGADGIATASDIKTNMRVLSRVNDNVIRVLLR